VYRILPKFYPNFTQILPKFYPNFTEISPRFYPNYVYRILPKFYPNRVKDLENAGQTSFTFFIVAPCILISIQFTHQKMHYLLNLERSKLYIKIHTKYLSYMFRSSTIIRELVLNLAKVIFILKRILHTTHTTHNTHTHPALCHAATAPNNIQRRNFTECFNINNFSQVQYKLPDDGRRPKHVGAMFCILM
jgi:hypothetical protein